MKVVHLTPAYAPHKGGVETHVAKISQEMKKLGASVTVLTVQTAPDSPVIENQLGIEIRRCPVRHNQRSWQYKLSIWRWIWQQRHILGAADVIQVHDVFWWLLPFVILWEDKICTTFHGWETQYPVRLSAKIQRAVWSFLSVATLHVGGWIQEFYWDKPTFVTYGAPPSRVTKVPKTPSTSGLKQFVFVGRLAGDTDIEKYLQLVSSLKKKHPKLQVTWVGDGPFKEACQKVGQVTGFVANPNKYIETADIVGASSYLSIWSALAQGKVVASFYSHRLKQRYLETFPAAHCILIETDVTKMATTLESIFKRPAVKHTLTQTGSLAAANESWLAVCHTYQKLWESAGIPWV